MRHVPKNDGREKLDGGAEVLSTGALGIAAVRESVAPPVIPAERTRPTAADLGPERELIRRAQRGDVAAYEELVRAHQQRIFAIAAGVLRRNEDLEDIVQQVLLKVYLSLKRFDLRSAFSTWLYKVTVNECLDYLRKKKVRRLVYEANLTEEQAQQLHDVEGAAANHPGLPSSRRVELRQIVDGLLEKLPEAEQLMLVLKEVEGLTVEEIGAVLDMNVNTVKVRLFRARGKLVEIYRRRLASRPARPAVARRA